MSSLRSNMVGWDIGGAHLKAVLLNTKGEVVDCLQLPCPLWKGLDYLQRAILHALEALSIAPSRACHAITMTGELVDLFENRHEGVCEIAKLATNILGEETLFYAANTGFVPLKCVSELSANIASTNWHASATALALQLQDALFVDIGSTTTDIIAIEGGKVASENLSSEGLSDAYRLQADSLVYTGIVRTPVMALAQKLDFEGNKINLAAEYFATMADVYRLTGELTTDDAETADGKGKTPLESARRLARMIGHDVEDKPIKFWINLAKTCKSLQLQQIKTAMFKQLKPNMTIIGAGVGSFLAKQIASDLNHNFTHAYQLVSMRPTVQADLASKQAIEVCFPAYSVAYLYLKSVFAKKYKPC